MAKSRTALSETQIRSALLAHLRVQLGAGDAVVEELGIEHGSARVDVAVAGQELTGFEIKSDYDTLDRLARQMHAYHRVFDALTLVTTPAYADQAEALLPSWWGIVLAEREHDEVVLTERRHALSHDRQESYSLASLLWRDEAYAFLVEESGSVVKQRAARDVIYEAIANSVPRARIRDRVLTTLRSRPALQSRLHVPSDKLSNRIDEMVTGGIPTPCHETA
jgi:hypothetical protein